MTGGRVRMKKLSLSERGRIIIVLTKLEKFIEEKERKLEEKSDLEIKQALNKVGMHLLELEEILRSLPK